MRLALTLVLSVLTAFPVGAVLGNAHRPGSLPWSDTVQVESFDPAGGHLVGVRLLVEAFVRADLRAENLGSGPDLVHAQVSALVRVALPNGESVAELPFDTASTWALESFDGKSDFAGSSGRSIRPASRRYTEVLIGDPGLLRYFVGPVGGGGLVELPVSAQGLTCILGSQDLLQFADAAAGVRVRVEYFAIP